MHDDTERADMTSKSAPGDVVTLPAGTGYHVGFDFYRQGDDVAVTVVRGHGCNLVFRHPQHADQAYTAKHLIRTGDQTDE